MIHRLLLIFILSFFSFIGKAGHVMGGDIIWTCVGGSYVFEMALYRDCNGAPINTSAVNIRLWGHSTVNNITMNFVSSSDVSPLCTQVTGGPEALDCGSGPNGGNGIGAIEKAIYRSDPIALSGTPPASGWILTYENFSRNNSDNLVDPSTKGLTLISKIFSNDNTTGCIDNSPVFLQEPYFISCAGDPYEYNMNAIDPDLDSLHISFGIPYDHFPGLTYSEGTIPAPVPFESGYSFSSPTPLGGGNTAAQINASSGNFTFQSNMIGNYNVKIVAQSFRNGVLMAEISREIALNVTNCSGVNNAPVITGPFGGMFETTINAGDLVNFDLIASDVELLQDGSPQSNILLASGPMFGTNFTSNSGCTISPCATLDATPLITMSQGVNTTFNWQTDCDHLVNPFGFIAESIPYHFVFKVQDDYCPVPKVSYATVTINVKNPGIVEPPKLECIQTDINGDYIINWNTVTDPMGTFNSYQVYSVQSGLLGTVSDINTTTFTVPGNASQNDFFIATASACNGNTLRYSDTISNIHLNLTNPIGGGVAVLQWNDPVVTAHSTMGDYYHIYQEYPVGTWTLYDSVPFGTHFYTDTITVCEVFLNYQVVLPNQPCDYTSNIAGDTFEDNITPKQPVIEFITVDTLTNELTLSWNENHHPDTYGYTIYMMVSGSLIPIDQVFGVSNTTYTFNQDLTNGALTFSVAAFDSCETVPGVYNESGKADPLHSTIFLSSSLDICSKSVNLNWTPYEGWENIDHYEVYSHTQTGTWVNHGSTTSNDFNITGIPGETYTIVIKAVSDNGAISFSNSSEIFISSPRLPDFNYLKLATVSENEVLLKHHIDFTANISEVAFQRLNGNIFEEIGRVSIVGNESIFLDPDVDINSQSYIYRVVYIDSCNLEGPPSNEARTIFLEIQNDEVLKLNYLNWNPYAEFQGAIHSYNVYRGIDSIFGASPIATLGPTEFSFTDDINNVISKGKICYFVDAIEGANIYNFSERSISNIQCAILPPIIYIPNAFMPDGFNAVFKPVISDFDPESYDLTIFDRWGQVIFRTNTPMEGWDGKIAFSHEMAETGTYVYMLTVKDGSGSEVTRRGHVSLLK